MTITPLEYRLKTITILFGLATLILAALSVKTFPAKADLPDGFNTPIIAFEFAGSEADVQYLIGAGDIESQNRQAMRDGHRVDMVFPFAYAGFLAMLLLQLALKTRDPLAIFGVPIAVLIICFDINENLKLLAIINAIENDELTASLFSALGVATWLKWGSIGVAVFIISLFGFKQKHVILGLFGLIYVGFTVAAATTLKPQLLEIMAFTILPFMLTAFVLQLSSLKLDTNENSKH